MQAEACDPLVNETTMDFSSASRTGDPSSRPHFPSLAVIKDGELVESLLLSHGKDGHVLLGRHPDCDAVLYNPLVNRHHLQIQIRHSSQELLLTDLNSAHLLPQEASSNEKHSILSSTDSPLSSTVVSQQNHACKHDTAGLVERMEEQPSMCSFQNNACEDDAVGLVESVEREKPSVPIDSQSYKDDAVEAAQSMEGEQPSAFIDENCDIVGEMEKVALTAPETKNCGEIDRSSSNIHTVCGDNKQEQSRTQVNNHSSRLWNRRTNLNPLPHLLTSKLEDPNAMNPAAPSAPPLPSCYSINNVSPSAPPLPFTPSIDDQQEIPDHENLAYQEKNGVSIAPDLQTDSPDVDLELVRREISAELHQDDPMDGYESDKENDSCSKPVNYTKTSHANVKRNSMLPWDNRNAIASSKVFTNEKKEFSEEDMETFASDKENQVPASGSLTVGKGNTGVLRTSGIPMDQTKHCRVPFQCLSLPASKPPTPSLNYKLTSMDQENRETKPSPPMMHPGDNSTMQRKFQQGFSSRCDPHRVWHIVVDFSCFVDPESFKALRLLEGIREVCLIVPKTVISELDRFRAGSGKAQKTALKWIESCMVKLPSWIHVQSSSECMMAVTPPASPCFQEFQSGENVDGDLLLSPTSADHVLDCAILFSTVISHGKVALLTNDTALRIKAMAEGLVCEAPPLFCESLVSPYSDRFLWSGSLAHGHNKLSEKAWHVTSALAPSAMTSAAGSMNKQGCTFMDTVRAMAAYTNPHPHHHHGVESLNKQCGKQAKGLKLVLI